MNGRAETKKYEIASQIHLATKVYLGNLNPFFTHLFKMDLGLIVHPNLGSFSQFFIIKTNFFKLLIPSGQHFKPMMTPTILKILLVSICELTILMNCCARCEMLRNYCSYFAH
jgi:hypothetical protein